MNIELYWASTRFYYANCTGFTCHENGGITFTTEKGDVIHTSLPYLAKERKES